MRRDQTDDNSQAHRNLMTFPAFETANGTTVVRSNLCQYPGGEGTGSTVTVRTNLAPNPRGVNVLTDYAGGATLTITGNVAITGNPDGITTANRVEYTSASVNPGITILDPLTSGTQYTASAWIYHEIVGGGTQGLAQSGIASQPSPPAITQGVWTRLSWTFTASGTSKLGFRVSSNTGAGSYLITGLLVETSPSLGSFFDGATSTTANLVKTAATALSGVTITTGINYAGSVWNRSTVIAGSASLIARQNVLLSDLGAGGKTYTASVTVANDQAFSQQVSIDWCDTAYVTVSLAPGEVRRLVTTSSRPVYDGTYRFSDLGVTQSTTEARSVLYKDWLIEEGVTSGAYYPATGDFTYAWSGTANASSSLQRATAAAGWNVAGQAVPYQSVVSPYAGTKCVAVATKGVTGDGVYTLDATTNPGTTYTFSSWIKLTEAVPSFYGNMRWKDAANITLSDPTLNLVGSLTVGQWTRLSYTTTAPANAVKLQAMWRIFSTHAPTTFYVDSTLIEAGNLLGTYFDGGTVAVGDFTYAWTGTANGSTSEQRAPRVSGTSGNYSNRVAWQSTDWSVNGTKSLAVLGGVPSIDSFSQFDTANIFGSTPLAGRTFTFMARLRTTEAYPAGADGRAWAFHGTYNLSGGGTAQVNAKPVTTGAGIHEIRQVVTFPSTATTMSFLRFYNGSPNAVPVYWDNAMIVEGEYTGDYIDGSKSFSKWDGTAHASTSVGYPPQLLDIAGTPSVDISGVANTGPLTVGAYDARTMYFIYEVSNTDASYQSPYAYGGTTNRLMVQTQTAGIVDMIPRADFPNGVTNSNKQISGTRTSGRRHIIAVAWNSGLTNANWSGNGVVSGSKSYAPGDGWTDGRLIGQVGTGLTPIRALIYHGAEHDAATMLAVQRYLGNKHGVNVA